jgi:hypothetical protein
MFASPGWRNPTRAEFAPDARGFHDAHFVFDTLRIGHPRTAARH